MLTATEDAMTANSITLETGAPENPDDSILPCLSHEQRTMFKINSRHGNFRHEEVRLGSLVRNT